MWLKRSGILELDTFLTSHEKAKEDATDLLQKKVDLEKDKKILEESVSEKEMALQKKLKTIGNYVHNSVPVSNNEVRTSARGAILSPLIAPGRMTIQQSGNGRRKGWKSKRGTVSHITKS